MSLTKEYNAVLRSLDTEERAVLDACRADFDTATTQMAVELTAVLGTYVSTVNGICERMEDAGFDEEEIRLCIRVWSPTRKDGEKKPGTVSRQHVLKTLNAYFDKPDAELGALAADLRGNTIVASQDSFAFLTEEHEKQKEKSAKTRAKARELKQKAKMVEEDPTLSLEGDKVIDKDGNEVSIPEPEKKPEHKPTKSNVETLADVLAKSDADLIAAALVQSGKAQEVIAALTPSVLPAVVNG